LQPWARCRFRRAGGNQAVGFFQIIGRLPRRNRRGGQGRCRTKAGAAQQGWNQQKKGQQASPAGVHRQTLHRLSM
jgi:hypothetical protein